MHLKEADVKLAFKEVFDGEGGDQDILDYLCSILTDEHFEFGTNGEEGYEALGDFLVGSTTCGPKTSMI